MSEKAEYPRLTAAEAAGMVLNGQTLGLGGFTTAGTPKAFAAALGERAEREQAVGRAFRVNVIGVATGPLIDGVMGRAIDFRTPYQAEPHMRERVNAGECRFVDMHLSQVTQALRYGFFGPLHWAVLEAAEVTPEGEILLTSCVGPAPTICTRAERIVIELNRRAPLALRGIHDIYEPADPPHRREIPIYRAPDRIGEPVLKVDPAKIAGVIETDSEDEGSGFEDTTPLTARIGGHVAEFLAGEIAAGRLPRGFLPVQSGVGNVANGVLGSLGGHPEIPPFEMYTEVVQDAVIRLMEAGRITFASCCSLSVSRPALRRVYGSLEWFKQRMVLRPQEITNHPEVLRRLGIISINTALEADIFGNVNSTHVLGRRMMNGIGGAGDFTRNAYLSIFTCPSAVKDGTVSTIVPMVSHTDHNEHSVQVLATEWGVADLRGRTPRERAEAIIGHCAHPEYRDALRAYVRLAKDGHTPHTLKEAFAFHERYERTGDMRVSAGAPPRS